MSSSVGIGVDHLGQQSSTFLSLGIIFVEDSFSTDQGGVMVSG